MFQQNGLTPLHVATHYDNQPVALLLLECGAAPQASGKVGLTFNISSSMNMSFEPVLVC